MGKVQSSGQSSSNKTNPRAERGKKIKVMTEVILNLKEKWKHVKNNNNEKYETLYKETRKNMNKTMRSGSMTRAETSIYITESAEHTMYRSSEEICGR